MAINDIRGQISVELVLILGIMVVVIMIIASTATPLAEQDAASSAAREGATTILYNITASNPTFQATRITEMTMVGDSEKTITITVHPSLPEEYKSQILEGSMKSVINQPTFTKTGTNTFSGNNYKYKIIIK